MRICSCRCLYCCFCIFWKGKFKGQYHQSDLTAGVKEDAAVYAVCILVYMLFVKKRQAGSATVSCLRQVCCTLCLQRCFCRSSGTVSWHTVLTIWCTGTAAVCLAWSAPCLQTRRIWWHRYLHRKSLNLSCRQWAHCCFYHWCQKMVPLYFNSTLHFV